MPFFTPTLYISYGPHFSVIESSYSSNTNTVMGSTFERKLSIDYFIKYQGKEEGTEQYNELGGKVWLL